MSLVDLPVELLHRIFALLPLSSTYYLGSTCRYLHRLIHQDDLLWRFKVSKGVKLLLYDESEDEQQQHELEGLIWDPTLQGHKELFLLYSAEFRNVLRSHRDQERPGDLELLIRSFLPKFLRPQAKPFVDPEFSPRVALFGPGIESPNTKHLVHKVVNSHTSLFDALGFVPGLPGGFGSGVKIDFRKVYKFDLACLYTNSASVRESQRGVTRLLAAHNKLLAKDALVESEEPLLHESVLRLLPTLDAIIFAVDGSELRLMADEEEEQQVKFLRSELGIMIDALESFRQTPILVLSCFWDNEAAAQRERVTLSTLATQLGLTKRTARPWAMFNVNIGNMDGMAKALDWVLFHLQKRRNNLEYHQIQSGKVF